MARVERTAEQLYREGLMALESALGVEEAIRFVQLLHRGSGDFTAERRARIERGELDDLVDEMHARAGARAQAAEKDHALVGQVA